MQAQYPEALVLEVKQASMSSADCIKWTNDFAITHQLLRDDGQVASEYSALVYEIFVIDRHLRITYRGVDAYSDSTKAEVLAELARLIP